MHLTIHSTYWTPTDVAVKHSGTIKILGVTFDNTGPQRT